MQSLYRIGSIIGPHYRLQVAFATRPQQIFTRMAAEHRNKRCRTEAQPLATISTGAEIGSGSPPAPASQSKPKKKKVLPPPVPVLPGALPDDLSIWDNAVLLIDKPQGWTSFDVCGKLRGTLAAVLRKKNKEVKVGHAGTLDPMATGLLIVCVGKATKSIDSFVAMKKEYSGVLRLGEATASYDADSDVTVTLPWEHLTDEGLVQAREGLLGEIDQLPPMFSAIRVGGKRLYESAREGKEVERSSRRVMVERFDLERDLVVRQDVKFYVVCSKGTYVRSLAHDLGAAAGSAAHLTALRREAIGEFRVTSAWNLEELAAALNAQKEKLRAEAKQQAGEQQSEGGEQPNTS